MFTGSSWKALLGVLLFCTAVAGLPTCAQEGTPGARRTAPPPRTTPRAAATKKVPGALGPRKRRAVPRRAARKPARPKRVPKPRYSQKFLRIWREVRRPRPPSEQIRRSFAPQRSVIYNQGVQVILDRRRQHLTLDVPEETLEPEEDQVLHPSLTAATQNVASDKLRLIPAAVLLAKAKQFDDGLLAAVEEALTSGAGRLPAKLDFITQLGRYLNQQVASMPVVKATSASQAAAPVPAPVKAAARINAAAQLGGRAPSVSPRVSLAIKKLLARFLMSPKSKPIGFYTWNKALSWGFRRDRLLQRYLSQGPGLVLARALAHNPGLARTYAALLRLDGQLTNPPRDHSLLPMVSALQRGLRPQWPRGTRGRMAKVAFFPPARSPEDLLFRRLYEYAPIPPWFKLMNEVIKRVRRGTLSLRPKRNAGWYAHKLYALEPLLQPGKTPEGRQLTFSKDYQKVLERLFRGSYALSRETQTNRLGWGAGGSGGSPEIIQIYLSPNLTTEPLATHYLRQARGYRFIRTVLEKALGRAALQRMKRQTARGPVNLSLASELQLMAGLYYGAYLSVCQEIGLKPVVKASLGSGYGAVADEQLYKSWADQAGKDPDLDTDLRMMVPIFYDRQRRKLKVWVVMGMAARNFSATFKRRPRVVGVKDRYGNRLRLRNGLWVWERPKNQRRPSRRLPRWRRWRQAARKIKVEIKWGNRQRDYIFFPVFAEVYVTKLLNREEFRRHCNRYKTKRKILANLK